MEEWVFGTLCPILAREKRDFQGVIESFFESFIQPRSQKKVFQWSCVKNFYNAWKNDLDKIWSLRKFCAFVFKLLCMYDCEDYQLITKIIYMYHEVMVTYESLGMCASCMQINNPKHYFYEDLEDTRSILSKINKIKVNFYRFTHHKLYSRLTINSIFEGDYDFLAFLVKYGVSYFPDNKIEEARNQLKRL